MYPPRIAPVTTRLQPKPPQPPPAFELTQTPLAVALERGHQGVVSLLQRGAVLGSLLAEMASRDDESSWKVAEMKKALPDVSAGPTYVKDDFFDTMSCEALEKQQEMKQQGGRARFAQMRRHDMETFGAAGGARRTQDQGGRGGRGAPGGRGAAGQGGRGGRGSGQGGRGGRGGRR